MAIERDIWTRWYHWQTKAIAQEGAFEEPPSSENIKAYSYLGEIPETLLFLVRNLKLFIIHFICWVSALALVFLMTLRPEDTPEDILELFDLIGIFGYLLPWIAITVFAISYREARGNLKGIANVQRVWMQWYQGQQETVRSEDTFEEPPSENTQADSYFRTVLKTVRFIANNPMPLIAHSVCWLSAFIFLYGEFLYFVPVPFVVIPALISSYQEARGTVKGTAKEEEVWTKWYQRQTEAKTQGYTLAEGPPSLNVN